MKRSFTSLSIAVAMVFAISFSLSAQNTESDSKKSTLYVKTLYIEKIYPHVKGYMVEYWTGSGGTATTYIPIDWFYGTAGKGVILNDSSQSSPYMEVFFIGNEFSYVRLHVMPSYDHHSWGAVKSSLGDISGKFANIEKPSLLY